MSRQEIRTAPWFCVVIGSAVFVPAAIAILAPESNIWLRFGLLAFSFIGLLGVADAISTRITNTESAVVIRSGFKSTTVEKSAIAKVSWEKGVGSHLTLKDGTFVKIPSTGHGEQGVSNTVRSWVRKG